MKVNTDETKLSPTSLSTLDEGFKPILKFLSYSIMIGVVGCLISFPLWIWFGWSIFWKTLLSGLLIYIPSNWLYQGINKAKNELIMKLKEKDMLIDDTQLKSKK